MLMDYARWRRRALRNNRIDEREGMELLRIVEPAFEDVRKLIKTQQHISVCAQGAEGMDSVNAAKSWEARQTERLWEGKSGPYLLPNVESKNGDAA
jgi:hypothetical protein